MVMGELEHIPANLGQETGSQTISGNRNKYILLLLLLQHPRVRRAWPLWKQKLDSLEFLQNIGAWTARSPPFGLCCQQCVWDLGNWRPPRTSQFCGHACWCHIMNEILWGPPRTSAVSQIYQLAPRLNTLKSRQPTALQKRLIFRQSKI